MFQREILQLIAANLALKKYTLTEGQWVLARHLAEILVVGLITYHSKGYWQNDTSSDLRWYHGPLLMRQCSACSQGYAYAHPPWGMTQKCSQCTRFTESHPNCSNSQPPRCWEVFKAIWVIRSIPHCHGYEPHVPKLFTLLFFTAAMRPDKKLTWFDDEDVIIVEQLVWQRWSDTHEAFAEASLHPNGPPIKVCCFHLGHLYGSKWRIGTLKAAFEWATHWGRGLVYWVSKLQANCKQMEKKTNPITCPAIVNQIYNLLSQFTCGLLSPANCECVYGYWVGLLIR